MAVLMPSDAEVEAALAMEEALACEVQDPIPEVKDEESDDELFLQAARFMDARNSSAPGPFAERAESMEDSGGFIMDTPSQEQATLPSHEAVRERSRSRDAVRERSRSRDSPQAAQPSTTERDDATDGGAGQADAADTGESSTSGSVAKTPVDILTERLASLCCSDRASAGRCGTALQGQPCRIIPGLVRHRATVRGIEVLFPFAAGPLQPQRQVMERVLEALTGGRHAVLESPTGTGKTAAVLCAALAWQRKQREKVGEAPQIIFASRTHAQLRQAVAELRRLPYRPTAAVVGSRESGLCIHAEVSAVAMTGGQLSVRQACRQARRNGSCVYHAGLQAESLPEAAVTQLRCGEPWDIEDAAAFGSESCACPYYLAHALSRHAELIFTPYSYVLDPSIRRAAGASAMELSGRVVVIDEAHNVESVCREAGSVEFSLDQMRGVLAALKRSLGEAAPQVMEPKSAAGARATSAGETASRSSGGGAAKAPGRCGRRAADAEELGGFLAPGAREMAGAAGRVAPGFAGYAHVDLQVRAGHESADAPLQQQPAAQVRRKRRVPPQLISSVRKLMALFGRMCNLLTEAKQLTVFAPHQSPHQRVAALLQNLDLQQEPLLHPEAPLRRGAIYGQHVAQRAARDQHTQGIHTTTHGEAVLREIASLQTGYDAALNIAPLLDVAANLLAQLAAVRQAHTSYVAMIDPVDKRALTLWLTNAEETLSHSAQATHSLIFMSGTLAPVASFVSELGPTYQQRVLPPLSAGHVIGRDALTLVAIGQFASTKLECNFRAWKREDFLQAIGGAIIQLCHAIPGGVLVFLPSYEILERCIQTWQCRGAKRKKRGAVQRITDSESSATWEKLMAEKRTIVVEPPPLTGPHAQTAAAGAQAVRAYEEAKRQYEEAVRRDGCAVLLAVYRGRMSEGVSFDDDYARGAICVGIPFPNLTEERLKQKRLCNDFWVKQGKSVVSGDAWYESRALQAVGQALGRCIRHPGDYGSLVLLDSRWIELGKAGSLPAWLQPFLRAETDVASAAAHLTEHFSRLARQTHQREREQAAATSVDQVARRRWNAGMLATSSSTVSPDTASGCSDRESGRTGAVRLADDADSAARAERAAGSTEASTSNTVGEKVSGSRGVFRRQLINAVSGSGSTETNCIELE
mmetsp:Transcript_3070/g.5947  ORF Transcript_3070/g.5947 Transcript_3070/m.5947 type:complete len:1151 (-) Transcript_3070:11-3463(-)